MIAQDVFILSMNLMDEMSSDGTYTGYPDEYKKKSWQILTILQNELLPRSVTTVPITDDQAVLQVSDQIGTMVLPYGLAAHLLLSENPQMASFFNDRYEELKRRKPAVIAPIKDVYGIKEGQDTATTNPNISTDTIVLSGGEW